MADRAESENPGNPAEASRPGTPLFISYASHDADTANAICEFLERHGLSCCLAPRDVKPRTQYDAPTFLPGQGSLREHVHCVASLRNHLAHPKVQLQ
jgi:hypothetical protein